MIVDLIIRTLQGYATDAEREYLRRWRMRAPENEAQYRDLETLWLLTGTLDPSHRPADPPEIGSLERLAAAVSQPPETLVADPSVPSQASRPGLRSRPMLLALAAGLGCLGFGLGAYARPAPAPQALLPFNEIVTGAGEMATFSMTDGTAIRVGPHSTLRLSIEDGDPVVWLSGRAFFGVHPDSTRIFTVRTAHGEAIALGTRFEVRSDTEEFRVLVVEGNVRVSAAGAAVELGDGLMSESRGGEPPSTTRVENVDQMLDWMGPTLMFRNTPLHRAVAEIEARHGVEVDGRAWTHRLFYDERER